MGVTDLRPCFTQIISHNSVNVCRIPTKLGTEIRLNEPFKCAKCQPDWSTNSCFMADFAKCAKRRRKKRRKKTQTLADRISEIDGAIFFKFGMWTPLPSRHFCSNFGFNRMRNHGATKVWKSRLLSSCKYTHGVARRLLGPHDTLLCVLIHAKTAKLFGLDYIKLIMPKYHKDSPYILCGKVQTFMIPTMQYDITCSRGSLVFEV